jgi:hypothetical protein|tara:strand:- start:249 stop:410 length:162 start_codon:yes stop_codon:yes gene_type:complete
VGEVKAGNVFDFYHDDIYYRLPPRFNRFEGSLKMQNCLEKITIPARLAGNPAQ